MEEYTIHSQGQTILCERRGKARQKFIFTHGAVGGLETPEMTDFANGFSICAQIVSFQGPTESMASRLHSFDAVLKHEEGVVAVGGRSMGSRAAVNIAMQALSINSKTMWATQLVLVSFPLIGSRDGASRANILLDLPSTVDVLFESGDRDSMCSLEELNEVRRRMQARSWLLQVAGASHRMRFEQDDDAVGKQIREACGRLASEWLLRRDKKRVARSICWNEELASIDDSGWH
jgi:predicted alpha/beta-hydrolase family hydrolase